MLESDFCDQPKAYRFFVKIDWFSTISANLLVSLERCAHVSDGPMSDVLVSDVLRAMCS